MVKFLVEHCDADIEFRRSDKCSALFYAIAKERTEAALYLLEKGADINAGSEITNKDTMTRTPNLVRHPEGFNGKSALIQLALHFNEEIA